MKFCVGDVVECIIQSKLAVFNTPTDRLYTIARVEKGVLRFKEDPYAHLEYSSSRFRVVRKDDTYHHLSHKIKQLEDRFKARTHV